MRTALHQTVLPQIIFTKTAQHLGLLALVFMFLSPLLVSAQQDKLLSTYNDQTQSDSIRVSNLIAYVNLHNRQNPLGMINLLNDAMSEFDGEQGASSRLQIHLGLSMSHVYNHNRDSASLHCDLVEQLSTLLNDSTGLAGCYGIRGILASQNGEHDLSISYLQKSAEVYKALNDSINLPSAYSRVGLAFRFAGNESASLLYMQKSKDIYERTAPKSRGLGVVLNNMGVMYEKQEQYNKSIPYYEQSLAIYLELNDSFGLADAYNNLGVIHKKLQLFGKAQSYYHKSLEIKLKSTNSNKIALTLGNFATLFLEKDFEHLDSAKHYIERAIELRKDEPSPSAESAFNHSVYGRVLNAMKQHQEAIGWCTKALALAEEYEWTWVQMEACLTLSEAHADLNEFEEAFHYYHRYSTLEKELVNLEKARTLVRQEMESDFNQERVADSLDYAKAQEITQLQIQTQEAEAAVSSLQIRWLVTGGLFLLVVVGFIVRTNMNRRRNNAALLAKNAEIGTQKAIIEKSLSEKDTLLREIHHRVKNNLQVVSSLLNLQSDSIEDKNALKAVKDGQNRVKSMALIHKKLYQTEHLTSINFQDYLEQLSEQICTAFGIESTTIQIAAQEVFIDIDTAVPLGLIVNELVTNSIKYALTDEQNSTISIELRQEESDRFLLVIKDQGNGLPDGVEVGKSETLGLRLVQLLSRQIKAKLDYKNVGGAQFSLQFAHTLFN
jgi:two-component sensor histidine kinase/Tfp pilus assembly protein PilF